MEGAALPLAAGRVWEDEKLESSILLLYEYFIFWISHFLSFVPPALAADVAEVPVWGEKLPALDHSRSRVFSLCQFECLF